MTVLDLALVGAILKESKNPSTSVAVGGNSTVAQVTVGVQSYAVKNYSSRVDAMSRQEREWEALVFLDEFIPDLAPLPIWRANEEPIAIHSWIHGSKPQLGPETVDAMIGILEALQNSYKSIAFDHQFPMAVDSISNTDDLSRQVLGRIKSHERDDDSDIAQTSSHIKHQLINLNTTLSRHGGDARPDMTLSPSDFGPHNMIHQNRGTKYSLIDLEFFGTDDIHKLIGDTILHPQTFWTTGLLGQFLEAATSALGINQKWLMELLPFLSLKWSTIVLGRMARLDGRKTKSGLSGELQDLALFYSSLARPGDLDNILSRIVEREEPLGTAIQPNEKE